MGMFQLSDIKDYWSVHETQPELFSVRYYTAIKNSINTTILYRSVMSRDRFLQIYWNLHLCDPTSPPAGRSGKVQPLLDLLCPKFASAFKPGEFVSVDEAMIAFKGWASFRQYVRVSRIPLASKRLSLPTVRQAIC